MYKRLFIIFSVILSGVFIGNKIYNDMEIIDTEAYQKDYAELTKLNHDLTGFYSLDSDYYAVMINYYEDTKKYVYPTNKKEYLSDKLRYYEEIAFKYKPTEMTQLKTYVQKELKNTQDTDTIAPNIFFLKNKELYLEKEEKLLPYYYKMRDFLKYKWIKDKSVAITNSNYIELKDAIQNLNQMKKIKDSSSNLPSIFWILHGGSGKKIPLDDFEKRLLI